MKKLALLIVLLFLEGIIAGIVVMSTSWYWMGATFPCLWVAVYITCKMISKRFVVERITD